MSNEVYTDRRITDLIKLAHGTEAQQAEYKARQGELVELMGQAEGRSVTTRSHIRRGEAAWRPWRAESAGCPTRNCRTHRVFLTMWIGLPDEFLPTAQKAGMTERQISVVARDPVDINRRAIQNAPTRPLPCNDAKRRSERVLESRYGANWRERLKRGEQRSQGRAQHDHGRQSGRDFVSERRLSIVLSNCRACQPSPDRLRASAEEGDDQLAPERQRSDRAAEAQAPLAETAPTKPWVPPSWRTASALSNVCSPTTCGTSPRCSTRGSTRWCSAPWPAKISGLPFRGAARGICGPRTRATRR